MKWFLWIYKLNLFNKKLFFEKKVKRVFNSYFIDKIVFMINNEIFILNNFVKWKIKLIIENYLYIINVNI